MTSTPYYRCFVLCLVVWAAGCGSTRAKKPTRPATTHDRVRAAAKTTLECLSGGGGDCIGGGDARGAWLALADLVLIDNEPAPLLGKALIARARQRERSGGDPSRLPEQAASALARDLSCVVGTIRHVGPLMHRRRKALLARAEQLGLGSLALGKHVGALAARANGLAQAYAVHARCSRGAFFLLVSPPSRAIDPDEDPRAHGSAGWVVFTVGIDLDVLLQGGAARLAKPGAIGADRVGAGAVDAWIPLGEVDL